MWKAYHRLRTSITFRKDWQLFLQQSVGHQGHPTFFQFISYNIFKELMKAEFPLPPTDAKEHPHRPLTFEERNALRFFAGYVLRNVYNKLEVSVVPERTNMQLCVMTLVCDEDDELEGTELWLNAIDRGGLWHVSDATYMLFTILEEDIRKFFTTRHLTKLQESTKSQIIDHLTNNGDVLFQWCLLTACIPDSAASLLLKKIVELYVTVRGFAFASSCVEMYKQQTKQPLQRKTALRKKIS